MCLKYVYILHMTDRTAQIDHHRLIDQTIGIYVLLFLFPDRTRISVAYRRRRVQSFYIYVCFMPNNMYVHSCNFTSIAFGWRVKRIHANECGSSLFFLSSVLNAGETITIAESETSGSIEIGFSAGVIAGIIHWIESIMNRVCVCVC